MPSLSLNDHGQVYSLEDKVASHFAEEDRIHGLRSNNQDQQPDLLNATGNVKFVDEAEHRRTQSYLEAGRGDEKQQMAEKGTQETVGLRTMPNRSPALGQTVSSVRVSVEKYNNPERQKSARKHSEANTPRKAENLMN